MNYFFLEVPTSEYKVRPPPPPGFFKACLREDSDGERWIYGSEFHCFRPIKEKARCQKVCFCERYLEGFCIRNGWKLSGWIVHSLQFREAVKQQWQHWDFVSWCWKCSMWLGMFLTKLILWHPGIQCGTAINTGRFWSRVCHQNDEDVESSDEL